MILFVSLCRFLHIVWLLLLIYKRFGEDHTLFSKNKWVSLASFIVLLYIKVSPYGLGLYILIRSWERAIHFPDQITLLNLYVLLLFHTLYFMILWVHNIYIEYINYKCLCFSVDEDFLDYKLVGNITLFINCIICLSYPLNFAIYCGMSR